MSSQLESHLFTYRHDGADWILEIQAKDALDARQRVGKLAYATYDGVQIATVPATLGLTVKLLAWLRNTARTLIS